MLVPSMAGLADSASLSSSLRISWDAFWGQPLTQSAGRDKQSSPLWSVQQATWALGEFARRDPFLRNSQARDFLKWLGKGLSHAPLSIKHHYVAALGISLLVIDQQLVLSTITAKGRLGVHTQIHLTKPCLAYFR